MEHGDATTRYVSCRDGDFGAMPVVLTGEGEFEVWVAVFEASEAPIRMRAGFVSRRGVEFLEELVIDRRREAQRVSLVCSGLIVGSFRCHLCVYRVDFLEEIIKGGRYPYIQRIDANGHNFVSMALNTAQLCGGFGFDSSAGNDQRSELIGCFFTTLEGDFALGGTGKL